MRNFALVGAAGYVAPRHMKAIKDTGNQAELDFAAGILLQAGLEQTVSRTRSNRDLVHSRILQHLRYLPELKFAT
jgi:hypothetical protein